MIRREVRWNERTIRWMKDERNESEDDEMSKKWKRTRDEMKWKMREMSERMREESDKMNERWENEKWKMSDLLCDNNDKLHKWLSKTMRLDLSYSSLLSLIFSHFFLSFFFIQFNSHQSCLSSLILFSLISHFFDLSYLSFLSSLIFLIFYLFSLFFVILWRTFI